MKPLGTPRTPGQAYMILLWSHVFQGDYAQVLALKEPFLRRIAQRFHLRWYVWTLCAVSLAYIFLGRWDDAVAEGRKGPESC